MDDRTILDLYRHDIASPREGHYAHHTPEGVRTVSTLEFLDKTVALADSLAALDITSGDHVLMLCDNRPEWHMVDLAVLSLGAANVPIYATLTPDQIAYQVNDSKPVMAVAENSVEMAKLLEIRERCPSVKYFLQVEGTCDQDVLLLEDLTKTTGKDAKNRFWDRASSVSRDDLATIVYTSGTTGDPKGVMLTHRNIVNNVIEICQRTRVSDDDFGLEFLPLCHMIERIAGYCYMYHGINRAYCSVFHVAELMGVIRPTIFASVPRILEKVRDAIYRKADSGPALRRRLFHWAIDIGQEFSSRHLESRPIGFSLKFQHVFADRLVLRKIRAALGGRLKLTFCGGAALPVFVNTFFHAIGLPVQEAWGLTESSPVITLNGCEPGDIRLGSVGRPLPSYQFKVAEDGELLAKGPSITQGYWNKPEHTAETIDADGFLHTGDIGKIDQDGFVFITDRKKDLIVTSGGKNIAPQPIENQLKSSPFVDNAVLFGDGKPFVVALLSPSQEVLESWAKDHGVDFERLSDLTSHPDMVAVLAEHVEHVNENLARFEQIKKFEVLPTMLSVEGGGLTPTLKVKRRVVAQQFGDLIEAMYEAE